MNLNLEEKYAHILKNSHLLNALQQKIMAELGQLSKCSIESISPYQNPSLYVKSIKLNTIYACTIPVFMLPNMDCIANYANPVMDPMIAVACFKKDQGYIIGRKCVTWIQSGGARVVGLKGSGIEGKQFTNKGDTTLSQTTISEKSKISESQINANKINTNKTNKIRQIINNTHALIIPEYFQIDMGFFQYVVQIIKEQKDLPILAIGNSAQLLIYLLFLSDLQQEQQKVQLKFLQFQSICNKNSFFGEAEVYLSWQNQLFCDLTIDNRLSIQNAAKIPLTTNCINIQAFNTYKLDSFLKIVGLAKSKSDPNLISFMKSIQYPHIYFSFIENYKSMQPESISLNHKIINNFIQIARKKDKKIQQKHQIQHFKLVVPQDEQNSYYNIDIKLAKI